MLSRDKFIAELTQNVRTNHPISVVYTEDPLDTLELIKSSYKVVRGSTDKLFYWTKINNWTDITDGTKPLAALIANPTKITLDPTKNPTPMCFTFMGKETTKADAPIFILSLANLDYKKDNGRVMQELRDFDYMVRKGVNDKSRIIILATPTFEVTPEYSNIFGVIRHQLPSKDELAEVFDNDFMTDYIERVVAQVYEGSKEKLIKDFRDLRTYVLNTLSGLTARQAYLIMCKGVSANVVRKNNEPAGLITAVDLTGFKEYLYNKKFDELTGGALKLLKPTPMAEVGGFEPLKLWLKQRQWAFSDAGKNAGIDTPKGMALIGPPGTGKTYIARATADTLQIPCIQLNVDEIFDKFVGNSEANMRRAIETIESMAPCVLFIDEVDKAFSSMAGGGQSGDSGATSRVFGKLLSWMQDNDKDIFMIVTMNRIQNVPTEFLRKGRLDEIFFVDFPSTSERTEIFNIHLNKRGHKLKDIKNIVAQTHEFSSAELEYLVKEATIQAGYAKEKLAEKHLLAVRTSVVPTSIAFQADVQYMRDWASTHARKASLEETTPPVQAAMGAMTPEV